MFPVDSGLVGDLGDILFLELVLLLIRRIRASPILPKVTNEFGMDAD